MVYADGVIDDTTVTALRGALFAFVAKCAATSVANAGELTTLLA